MDLLSASQRLAAWVSDLRYSDIPPDTLDYTKQLVLDHLGCAARGGVFDSSPALDAALERLQPYDGTTTVVVGKRAMRPEWAIMANGSAAHSLELDDTHTPGSMHPAVIVIPAALAAAELEGASGADFLTAVVAGYEVAGRLGRALGPKNVYDRGFHPTPVIGPFSSAAAAGRLLGLDAEQLAHAFGIAASQSAGLMEFVADGSWTKRMHPGWAGHAGYTAARLAQSGFTGPRLAFEGRDGLLRAYGMPDAPELVTDNLGSPFEITQTSVKPHACCRYNQGAIDLTIALAAEHGLSPEDVEAVEVGLVSSAMGIVVDPRERKIAPQSPVDAQFSLPYAIGLAIAVGRASLDEYDAGMLEHPGVLEVARRVEGRVRPDFDERFPRYWPTEVTIRTRDGRTLSAATDAPKGDPENRLTAAEMQAKFRSLADKVFDEQALQEIERSVDALDEGSMQDLLRALAGGAGLPGEAEAVPLRAG
jgi:2-methylcitrate dehydratase PrpD